MLSRGLTNLLLLVLAACLDVFCFALGAGTIAAIALGVGCAAVIVSLGGFALRERGAPQRTLDVAIALSGAWLIVASRCLASADQRWNSFGIAAAIASLSVVGLLTREAELHELLGRLGHAVPGATVRATGAPPAAEQPRLLATDEPHRAPAAEEPQPAPVAAQPQPARAGEEPQRAPAADEPDTFVAAEAPGPAVPDAPPPAAAGGNGAGGFRYVPSGPLVRSAPQDET